jgi:hypothetical protein
MRLLEKVFGKKAVRQCPSEMVAGLWSDEASTNRYKVRVEKDNETEKRSLFEWSDVL